MCTFCVFVCVCEGKNNWVYAHPFIAVMEKDHQSDGALFRQAMQTKHEPPLSCEDKCARKMVQMLTSSRNRRSWSFAGWIREIHRRWTYCWLCLEMAYLCRVIGWFVTAKLQRMVKSQGKVACGVLKTASLTGITYSGWSLCGQLLCKQAVNLYFVMHGRLQLKPHTVLRPFPSKTIIKVKTTNRFTIWQLYFSLASG